MQFQTNVICKTQYQKHQIWKKKKKKGSNKTWDLDYMEKHNLSKQQRY